MYRNMEQETVERSRENIATHPVMRQRRRHQPLKFLDVLEHGTTSGISLEYGRMCGVSGEIKRYCEGGYPRLMGIFRHRETFLHSGDFFQKVGFHVT